jgi:mitochondrial enoyl-[acyl-carrier protein] reductase / trans-2-enoyl-CoA reductase
MLLPSLQVLRRFCAASRFRLYTTAATAFSPPSTAVIYDEHGPPDQVLRLVNVPPVKLGDRDVCVRMLAAPINPSDINRVEGVYPVRPPLPAAVGGYEGVGQVHALGPAITAQLAPGDWVIPSPLSFGTHPLFPSLSLIIWFTMSPLMQMELGFDPLLSFITGTWQTYIVKHESVWHKVCSDVPMEYAATVTVNPLTALRMLQDFVKLYPGIPLFFHQQLLLPYLLAPSLALAT